MIYIITGILFVGFGYLSFDYFIGLYLEVFDGITNDIREIFTAPILVALFYLVYYVASILLFKKIKNFTPKKELAFQFFFLIVNGLLSLSSFKISIWRAAENPGKATQLLQVDNLSLVTAYALAALLSLIIFVVVRIKWR
ncbi:hypothetical protein [Pantoea dispersa]|uniref:hypothetical protein n=1 Tax=Pantoea dispersa TaxID=59814 RepID=UPI0021F7E911|nr:hypothetical protein [Pantoea dispersa]UYP73128.1 hypothetical protein OF384_17770 [Pantoea dispersa]